MLQHATMEELEAGVGEIRASPTDRGTLDMIVRRPAPDQREILTSGYLDLSEGLKGDSWNVRPSSRTADGSPHPDMQLNLMNTRAIQLIARTRDRWHLAGDQLFVDLDLSTGNLPPGTRLVIGGAIVEVTDQPHRGCRKFFDRFGDSALRFVNSEVGQALNLRGICAKVVQAGSIQAGDRIEKV